MTYNAISVTELNKYIKGKFEDDERLNNILVKGKFQILNIIIQVICILL